MKNAECKMKNAKCNPHQAEKDASVKNFAFCNLHFSLNNSEGVALVLTLVVLAVLTALIVEFSYGVYVSTNSLYNWQALQKLSITARSALRLAAKAVSDNLGKYSYTHPDLIKNFNGVPFPVDRETASVWVEDEGSRFNVNSVVFPNGTLNEQAYNSFLRLLKALELETGIADRIVDWIDPDSAPRLGDSERGVKSGYLDSIDEILLIEGIDGKTYERLLPYVTIYGNGLINVNSAPEPVLMSLSDAIDREMAGRIARFRQDSPFERPEQVLRVAGFDAIGTSLMGRITVKGAVFHITAVVKAGDIRKTVESVLEISGGAATVRYWREI